MDGCSTAPPEPSSPSEPTGELPRIDRLRAVFGLGAGQPLPRVSPDSLEQYGRHLAQLLDGTPLAGQYLEAGRFLGDRILLLGISPWVDDIRGVLAQIAGDSLSGEVPLLGVRLDGTEAFCDVVEDYHWWWRNHRTVGPGLAGSWGNQPLTSPTIGWCAGSSTADEV